MRKNVTKILLLVLSVVMLLATVACGGDNGGGQVSDEEFVQEALEQLDIPSVNIPQSITKIEPKFKDERYNSVTITITSSKTDVIANDGTITRTMDNETVSVTFTLKYKDATAERTVNYKVSPDVNAVNTYLDGLLDDIDLPEEVTEGNLTLPTIEDSKVSVQFSSSKVNIINNEGKVTYPLVINATVDDDITVECTVTLTRSNLSRSKTFTVVVKAREPQTDEEKVNFVKDALRLLPAAIDNIELPATDSYGLGTTITWATNNAERLSNTGVVSRLEDADARVTLTATITKGEVSVTKDIDVTVLRTSGATNGVFARASKNNQMFYIYQDKDTQDVWLEFEGIAFVNPDATTRKIEFALDHTAGDQNEYADREPYDAGWFQNEITDENTMYFRFLVNLSEEYNEVDPAQDWIKFFLKVTEDDQVTYLANGNNKNGLSFCITGEGSWPSGDTGNMNISPEYTDSNGNLFVLRVNWGQIHLRKNPA